MILIKDNKAQALVEFVLLLPIILILIFSSIDILNLILEKNELSNKLDEEILLVERSKETIEDLERKLTNKNIIIKTKESKNYLTIKAEKEIKWISPLTELILKNYTISLKRVIPLE